jgi:hypothetical protein
MDILIAFVFFLLSISFVFFVIWLRDSIKGKGIAGELVVAYFLNKLDKTEYKVINNLKWNTSRGTVQIDHVVVSKYGIFVIETKNWTGTVYGKFWDAKWVQYLKNKRYYRDNPKYQNDWHIKKLKEVLSKFSNVEYFSLLVFSGMTERKIFKDKGIRISELVDTIESYKEEVISEEDRDSVYKILKSLKVNGNSYKKEHVENMKRMYGK